MAEKRKQAKKIDSFAQDGTVITLWLMPRETLLLVVTDRETNQITRLVNSKAVGYDEDEVRLEFERLKAKAGSGDVTRLNQAELFDEDDLEKIGLASLN